MAQSDQLQSFQAAAAIRPRPGLGLYTLTLVRRQPLGAVGVVVLAALLIAAAFAPVIATHSPTRSSADILVGPSKEHLFGTDWQGRDQFSRIIHGARVSVYIGLAATALGVFLGALVGICSGYFLGVFDLVTQRIVDILMAFPQLILLLAIVAALGPSIRTVVIAIAVGGFPSAVRIIRSAVLGIRAEPYIEASRVIGAPTHRILFLHILPNIMAALIVIFSIRLGAAILAEASLSFLGFGVPPPNPSWGRDLSGQARQFFDVAPWLGIFPGLAITIVVLATNFVGDSLRDILDPRLRGR